MNILIVIDTPSMGGAQRVSISLSKWFLEKEKVNSFVVALNDTSSSSYSTADIKFESLHGHYIIKKLHKYVLKHGIDIVITMGVPLCVYTIPALLGLNVKHIVSERNSPAHFAGKWITKKLSRFLMRNADGFVFQTKQAQTYYGGKIAARSIVIPNPVLDLSDYTKTPAINREKKIVAVGRLVKQKNFKLLIEAFSELSGKFSDYQLIIYGDGAERADLEKIIKSYNLQNRVSISSASDNIHQNISSAALFVMSSDFEGMPNALMEAMALGLPCISTNCPCGGPSELIKNGENGLLVPIGNRKSMTDAIMKLLSNLNMAESLGKAATRIRETHSMDKISRRWLDYIEMITS